MASKGSTQAIIKRREDELALMPPPPTKRIKRPTEVLDEDEYTEALSDIIARDYYPGLREAKAQEEYLNALDSKNPAWILEAERKLQQARDGESEVKKVKRTSRDSRFDTPRSYRQAADTPTTTTGLETPLPTSEANPPDPDTTEPPVNTNTLSLSAYQAKYTSEDNASFNDLLDAQNARSRKSHAHLWTATQTIPSHRLLTRPPPQKSLPPSTSTERTTALIPLISGATATRSATPSSWTSKTPTNTLMFTPDTSVDEQGLPTIQAQKEALSKAPPKQIMFENTRFPPSGPRWEAADDEDDATSIHTSFIARRNVGGGTLSDAGTVSGAETPRVNGYAFVDEDDDQGQEKFQPSYRDMLAGQAGDAVANPFKVKQNRSREDLHYRLVERDAERKRAKQKETVVEKGGRETGNMTPAAKRLMERLGGRTPKVSEKSEERRVDWTPVATPRRARTAIK